MAMSARDWFLEHPPGTLTLLLERVCTALNGLLAAVGLLVALWSVVTVAQIQASGPPPGPAPPPPLPGPPPSSPVLQLHGASSSVAGAAGLANVPWFIFVFGALGAATAATATLALLGTRLRSTRCLGGHTFLMCLLLTGQACAAVAFFIDAGWRQRLPPIDEQLMRFLAARLEVCKWVGVGLFMLQLLTLLLTCGLQSIYVSAEEAAEDADEEDAWRRRPLLQQQARRQQQQQAGGRGPSPVPGAAGGDDDGWSSRMQEQYGLDTTQFSYRPRSRGGGGGGAAGGDRGSASGRGCNIM